MPSHLQQHVHASANARHIGSAQIDSVQRHKHAVWDAGKYGAVVVNVSGAAQALYFQGSAAALWTGLEDPLILKDETRPKNTAFLPIMYI